MDGQPFPGICDRVWLGYGDLFLGEPIKIPPNGLYKVQVLFFGVNVWYNHFILVKLKPPILGVENVLSVPTVVGDTEPPILKFWGAKYVSNTIFVEPTTNGTKTPLLVDGSGTCIAITKLTDVPLPHLYEDL